MMENYEWKKNPEYQNLPKIEVGDIVQLKISAAFDYLVKAIVTQVGTSEITAHVEAVFDWQSRGQILSGNMTELENKELVLKPYLVHKVIKRKQTKRTNI